MLQISSMAFWKPEKKRGDWMFPPVQGNRATIAPRSRLRKGCGCGIPAIWCHNANYIQSNGELKVARIEINLCENAFE
jgi:hypothetical protein